MILPENCIQIDTLNGVRIVGRCDLCESKWSITLNAERFNDYQKGEDSLEDLDLVTSVLEKNVCITCLEAID